MYFHEQQRSQDLKTWSGAVCQCTGSRASHKLIIILKFDNNKLLRMAFIPEGAPHPFSPDPPFFVNLSNFQNSCIVFCDWQTLHFSPLSPLSQASSPLYSLLPLPPNLHKNRRGKRAVEQLRRKIKKEWHEGLGKGRKKIKDEEER